MSYELLRSSTTNANERRDEFRVSTSILGTGNINDIATLDQWTDISTCNSQSKDNGSKIFDWMGNHYLFSITAAIAVIWISYIFIYYVLPIGALAYIIHWYIFASEQPRKNYPYGIVHWNIPDVEEKLNEHGFLYSEPITEDSGHWRLVITQKNTVSGLQTSFGFLMTHMSSEVDAVDVIANFATINFIGQPSAPGLAHQSVVRHRFVNLGEVNYTEPFRLAPRHLLSDKSLSVQCQFARNPVIPGIVKRLGRTIFKGSGHYLRRGNDLPETGTIELLSDLQNSSKYYNNLSDPMYPVFRFICHPDTKTFVWKIPQFPRNLQNNECWGLFSPNFFVNSHNVCTTWRMKLFEVSGTFRLHVQLRGLSHDTNYVQVNQIIQMWNAPTQEIVIPIGSKSNMMIPDYISIWTSIRHILYDRSTMLQMLRGSENDTLCIRVSIKVEENALSQLNHVDSDQWILNR